MYRLIKKNRLLTFYITIILLIIIASMFPEFISGHSPFAVDLSGASPPGRAHFFGTDFLGRDVLSRTLIAGRISLVVGVAARLGSIMVGLVFGLIIGLSSKTPRFFMNSVVEVFMAIPALLLAMGLAVVLGEGYRTIIIAIVVGTWAPVARFISSRVEEIKNKDYFLSAKAIGTGRIREMVYYLIPSLLPVLLPLITTGIASSIMMESTLTFLGLGGGSSLDKIPSWGLLIQEGSKFIFDAGWLLIPPSVFLMVLILCFNNIGDKIASEKIAL